MLSACPSARKVGWHPVLQPEKQHPEKKYGHHPAYQADQLLIIGKKRGIKSRKAHGRHISHKGYGEADRNHAAVQSFYPIELTRAVIIADNGLHTLGEAGGEAPVDG